MSRSLVCVLVIGILVIAAKAGSVLGAGGTLANKKCITLLNPKTCDATASSVCNERVTGGGPCVGQCGNCNDATVLPDNVCLPFDSAKCDITGQAATICDPSALYYLGSCTMVPDLCRCTGRVPGGVSCGTNWYYFPCVK